MNNNKVDCKISVFDAINEFVIVMLYKLYSQYCTLGLDRYRAGARYSIPDTISRSYTDYWAVQIFCTKNAFLCGV